MYSRRSISWAEGVFDDAEAAIWKPPSALKDKMLRDRRLWAEGLANIIEAINFHAPCWRPRSERNSEAGSPIGQANPVEYGQLIANYRVPFWSEQAAIRLETDTKQSPVYKDARAADLQMPTRAGECEHPGP